MVAPLAACGSSGDDSETNDPQARLATAQSALDDAERLDFTLTIKGDLPNGVSGLESADGFGNRTPAFEGDVTVSTGGASVDAEIVALAGTVWAKLSFSPVFMTIDPADYGAPDPAVLIGPHGGGLVSLLSATTVTGTSSSRDGRDVLTSIEGTVAGSDIVELLPASDPDATFKVTYRLTDDDELRDLTVTGPFYGGSDRDVTYVVTIEASDEPADISAP